MYKKNNVPGKMPSENSPSNIDTFPAAAAVAWWKINFARCDGGGRASLSLTDAGLRRAEYQRNAQTHSHAKYTHTHTQAPDALHVVSLSPASVVACYNLFAWYTYTRSHIYTRVRRDRMICVFSMRVCLRVHANTHVRFVAINQHMKATQRELVALEENGERNI